jgi:hypothetical protein
MVQFASQGLFLDGNGVYMQKCWAARSTAFIKREQETYPDSKIQSHGDGPEICGRKGQP